MVYLESVTMMAISKASTTVRILSPCIATAKLKSDSHLPQKSWKMFFISSLNPIQDGPFQGCSRMIPISKICHISYNDETWHSYTLSKKDPKNIWITWHTPWVMLTSAFFHRKSANFAISRNKDINCILIHNSQIFLSL